MDLKDCRKVCKVFCYEYKQNYHVCHYEITKLILCKV